MTNFDIHSLPSYDPEIERRVCFITGGNSGIGYYTALNLYMKGYIVYIASRSKQRMERAINDIREEAIRRRLKLSTSSTTTTTTTTTAASNNTNSNNSNNNNNNSNSNNNNNNIKTSTNVSVNASNTTVTTSSSNSTNKTPSKLSEVQQLLHKKLTAEELEVYGIEIHSDRIQPGVHVRSQKIASFKPSVQAKVHEILGQMGLSVKPTMPTGPVSKKFDELLYKISHLVDLKKQSDKLLAEIELVKRQKGLV